MTFPRSSHFRIAQFYSKTERCTRWQPAHTKSRKLIRAMRFSPHEARHSAVQNTGRKFQLLLHYLRTRYDSSDRDRTYRNSNKLNFLQTKPGSACRRNSPTASPTGSLPAIPRTRVHRGPWPPCSSRSGGSEDCAPGTIPVRLSNC